uniref:Ubiquinone/menaquinone biosynthesis C-methylase UbiE n=1 Tax=Candidatus Kentrum sp. LFY TaxID=2126342 RepID=A0A450WPJ6_9GAMM|nr:MAG: Ubiquinone/menaquinone biosynthesis C-methylase UbiE [Candidatus Kentron sp. LFY]
MKRAEYENYDETFRNYDTTRIPVGLEILLGFFASIPRPLNEQKILDLGCGTGNYIEALKDRIGHLHGLEITEGMLSKARQKLGNHSNISLTQGNLLDPLPYGDNRFDGVMCNQVLHHLVTDSHRQTFSEVRPVIEETHRVLRSPGVLAINTSSHHQLFHGFWWADLIPEAVDRISRRFPPIEFIQSILQKTGFRAAGIVVPIDAVLQAGNYLDPMGPVKKRFRDGDSTWSLATKEELQRACERVRTMNEHHKMEDYMKARERLRANTGQTTFIFAHK